MSLFDNLPDECTIRRRVRVADSVIGSRDAHVEERTAVPCWMMQASASEVNDFQKRGIRVDVKVYFDTDPRLTERHQILVTRRSGIAQQNPIVYDVVSQPAPDVTAGFSIGHRVMATTVSGRNQ